MNWKRKLLKYTQDNEFPKQPGIYILENRSNSKVYIGYTMNIKARIASHRSLLLNNKHYNRELQFPFNRELLIANVLAIIPHANSTLLKDFERILIKSAPQLFPSGIINKQLSRHAKY